MTRIDAFLVRKAWFTLTFKNDVRVMQKTVELHAILMEEMKAIAGEDGFTSMCVSTAPVSLYQCGEPKINN